MTQWLFRNLALIRPAATALLAVALSTAPLLAVGPGDGPPITGGGSNPNPGGGEQPTPNNPPVTPGDVPEINPGTAVGAFVLLIGGTLLLTDRYRRRDAAPTQQRA